MDISKSNNSDDIFGSVLNLEDEFYKEGYEEGVKDGKNAGLIEGKQFGIQTGFQRFISVGILQARLNHWRNQLDGTSDRNIKNINQLASFLDDIPYGNGDEDVEIFEKKLKKAKAKAKVLEVTMKDEGSSLNLYDEELNLKAGEETIEEGR